MAALVILVPVVLAACTERPAYVVDPDRAEPPYPEPAAQSYERPTYTVIVREGDSISKIAARCDTTDAVIVRMNDLDENRPIYPGQILRVPSPPHEQAAREDRVEEAPLEPVAQSHRPKHIHDDYADVTPRERPEPDLPPPPPPKQTADNRAESWWDWWMKPYSPPAEDTSGEKFMWPLQGRIILPYGRDKHGERNDGINIAADEGAPIRAAAAGTVTYAGNELKGYGNLVLIRHADGYVTAYAHAGSIRVTRGEMVEKGQIIGTAGQTGDVDRPQLHFEIRRGVQAVDPERYLDRAS